MELGVEEYGKIFHLQKRLHEARRIAIIPDIVIFLEHCPCLTIGRNGNSNHILVSAQYLVEEGIKIYETDRGGDITYHGPGQLVCYPIFDLNTYGQDLHMYVRRMEEILIRSLDSFGIAAGRKKGYPGAWTGDAKIAAVGIGVRHWVTMHGISLNVCPDLGHFSFIVPCGISQWGVTSMKEILGHPVDMMRVRMEMRRQFSEIFDLILEDISIGEILDMVAKDARPM